MKVGFLFFILNLLFYINILHKIISLFTLILNKSLTIVANKRINSQPYRLSAL